jgi:hypothetical protein
MNKLIFGQMSSRNCQRVATNISLYTTRKPLNKPNNMKDKFLILNIYI